MKLFGLMFWIFLSVYGIAYLYLLIISRKPLRYLLINALCGWWCFATLELLSFLTGVHIPLNYGTVAVSGVLGVPGTLLLLILRYCIFI